MGGPLEGIRVVEIAAIGPTPFCGMMLADHGADVIRVERPGKLPDPHDILQRSRRSITVDMKAPDGVEVVRDLVGQADVLLEGFRPGVMERLGLGPDDLFSSNPKLVYGRMTGWGQTGPLAPIAGHDINYISIAGALHGFGEAGRKPVPPMNLVGDFGGGGMMLAFGIVSALHKANATGQGQVVDCAMVDGAALLMSMIWSHRGRGNWSDERGANLFDGGAPFYDTYECADGRYIAIGPIEPQFYALLRDRLGLTDDAAFDQQMDRATWPHLKERLREILLTRTRDEWCAMFDGTDACVTPVLTMGEAIDHPHNASRGAFPSIDGMVQPAPAPRYSHTPLAQPRMPDPARSEYAELLAQLGYDQQRVDGLRARGIVA